MRDDTETRILIQQKSENGEFETVKTDKDIVGVIFDENKPFALITGSVTRMDLAVSSMAGYVMGQKEAMKQIRISKVGGPDA